MLPNNWRRNGFGNSAATPPDHTSGPAGLLRELLVPAAVAPTVPSMPMDVTEHSEAYEVLIDLPGMAPDAFDVSLLDGTLTVVAERPRPTTGEGRTNWHRERRFGRFTRTVELAVPVNEDEITATYIDGVLRLYVPKTPAAMPHRIEITRG